MHATNRRAFLEDVGRTMLLAGVGPALVSQLGLRGCGADAEDERLHFGRLEPLAALLQETPGGRLQAELVRRLKSGTTLKDLVAAAALANARTFGGQDYTGYHCAMALVPALQMASQMKGDRLSALPVLKVLQRNTDRIQQCGGRRKEVLRQAPAAGQASDPAALLAAERRCDMRASEVAFAGLSARGPAVSYEALQDLVRENIDVHQVVLAWRAWDLLRITGQEHASTMLRQAMRQCVDRERNRANRRRRPPAIRELLPRLLEQHQLLGKLRPAAPLPDGKIDELATIIFTGGRSAAASATARALGSGWAPEDVGAALSLAAVRLLLHDPGRSSGGAGRPRGSVHGASTGVHASDAASAWRNIARVCSQRTAMASLVTAAWHTGGQAGRMDTTRPRHSGRRKEAAGVAPEALLDAVDACIRGRDQGGAAAHVERYGSLNLPAGPLQQCLLGHAVRNDGALHHEKYFRTASEEFAGSRPAFRWLHLAALARVCASGYGWKAPGLSEARRLLG